MPPGCFQAQAFGLEILVDSALEELRAAFAAGERHLHMDHVVPIKDRQDLRLDLGNVQTLCSVTANRQVHLIGMEACGGAHFLGRPLREQGHEVRLIPA